MLDKWYKLDNAAKLFPPTTTYYDPKIFRFSCVLKDNINVNNLNIALNKTLEAFPIFKSTLKKGFFWYYLESSNIKPNINEESTSPCESLNTPLLFEVTYYHNKINLEVYHALSDGTGCMAFFQELIFNYLKIQYHLKDTILNKSSNYEQNEDSFKKYYKAKKKIKLPKTKNAYHLKGPWYPDGKLKIITGITSTKKLKELANKYDATITILLISLIIKSLEPTMNQKAKIKPVSITVPIDLRKYFKSNTIRNFFNVTNIQYLFEKNDTPLEDIIKKVKNDLNKALKPEILSAKMNRMIALENIIFIRLIPLFLKNIILKYSYKHSRNKQTLGLSNIGVFVLPEECQNYIKEFIVFNSTDAFELCICSYQDQISLSFSSHFKNSEIEKNFFRALSNYGLDIDIYTNNIEERR